MNTEAYAVLFVDSDSERLATFRYAMGAQFRVLTAQSAQEALRYLQGERVAAMVAALECLEISQRARHVGSQAVRVMLASASQAPQAQRAVDEGHAELWLLEPWSCEQMAAQLRVAVECVHLEGDARQAALKLLQANSPAAAWHGQEELAHELANPLGALAVNVQFVYDHLREAMGRIDDPKGVGPLLQQALEAQGDALEGVQQLRGLVERLRRGVGPSTPPPDGYCDVHRVVSSTLRLVRSNLGPNVQAQVIEHGRPVVAMDVSAFGQVVLNLLINASRAVQKTPASRHFITVRVDDHESSAIVRVSDTGPGIDDSVRARMFERHVGTQDEGRGLGLTIARELVTQAGGRISLESKAGRGATFVVELPKYQR
ncbi:MAG: ATP-binding protein [Proteobacteria bacterium]|nr:ATP-binding protein [Pseudomonadota bacterium]